MHYFYTVANILCHMQAVDIQHAQQVRPLKEELELEEEELRQSYPQVRYNIEHIFFANAIRQLLQLQANGNPTGAVLLDKGKCISPLEGNSEAKQAHFPELQTKKQLRDSSSTCSDVPECE